MTFRTGKEAKRWLEGPNLSYWSQALNFAVWCSTAGCGVTRDMLRWQSSGPKARASGAP